MCIHRAVDGVEFKFQFDITPGIGTEIDGGLIPGPIVVCRLEDLGPGDAAVRAHIHDPLVIGGAVALRLLIGPECQNRLRSQTDHG